MFNWFVHKAGFVIINIRLQYESLNMQQRMKCWCGLVMAYTFCQKPQAIYLKFSLTVASLCKITV